MLTVCGLQLDLVWEDPALNFERAERLIESARRTHEARLIVLPEMFATGFSMRASAIVDHAEKTSRFLSECAVRHGCWVLGGLACAGIEKPRNTAVLYDPEGHERLRYEKIHPFSLAHEDEHFEGGLRLPVVTVEGVRLCVLICYDLRFPEPFRLRADEVDLFIVIANWPEARRAAWSTLLAARAIENQAYVLGVNRVGEGNGLRYTGDSALHGPLGEVLESASLVEALVAGEIDPQRVEDVRAKFGFLGDRRPEVYKSL
ncbi:MAG: carbon-nitrogen family hydrolase [Myxococcales bacterium]|nr:carbon-nitrogen family hydrolase [Myxococcales bacterium]